MIDGIFIFRTHAFYATAALVLRMVYIGIDTFHITAACQRQNHPFIRNHIFNIDIRRIRHNLRTPFVTKFLLCIK